MEIEAIVNIPGMEYSVHCKSGPGKRELFRVVRSDFSRFQIMHIVNDIPESRWSIEHKGEYPTAWQAIEALKDMLGIKDNGFNIFC